MKKLLPLLLLTLNGIGANAQQTSVLFIGNSYIYTADLPGTFRSLALAGGDSVYYESNTPGGHTFEQHSTNVTTLNAIINHSWDFVVLQEQSQKPAFPPAQVASETYPYAQALVDTIHAYHPCAEPVFFMTWGRRDGDQANCQFYPPLCTFEGMNARLRESYLEMGSDNDATVAPCGAAWHQMSLDNNTFWNGLYSGDGSHPSAWGTYLNACVFYATIFRKSPVGITYYSSIGQQDAETLQQLAEDIVLDSLSNWYIGHRDVVAVADHAFEGGLTVSFNSSSLNATAHEWHFGDGTFSNEEDPQHTYPSGSILDYQVTYVAQSECDADTLYMEVSFNPFSIEEKNVFSEVVIRVSGNILEVWNGSTTMVEMALIDQMGRVLTTDRVGSSSSDHVTAHVASGIYLIRLSVENEVTCLKVMIQH